MDATTIPSWPDALHLAVLRYLGGKENLTGYLKPYRELCSACLQASCHSTLWREVDFSPYFDEEHLLPSSILAILSRCSPGCLERLTLRGIEAVDDALVAQLVRLPACTSLRSLDLGACQNITGKVVEALEPLQSLEELSLECMAALEDADVLLLCHTFPRLHSLDVRHCERLTDATSLQVRQASWTSLQLDGCFRFQVGELLTEGGNAICHLQHLSLDGEDLEGRYFLCLAATCPDLQTLAVSFAREMEPPALTALAGLPRLHSLTLKKASQPRDIHWAEFFSTHRTASSNKAAESGSHATPPANGPWSLLSFAECEFFADKAIFSLAEVLQPALLEVDLSWCWHVTDKGLCSLLKAAPNLQRVKLAGSKGLTGAGLVPCCWLHSLEELDCTSCNSVPDGILEFLHRLFAGPPGSCDEALPGTTKLLPPLVREVISGLWTVSRHAQRWTRLRIKNYYAEYLENWSQLHHPLEVCEEVEALLGQHYASTSSSAAAC